MWIRPVVVITGAADMTSGNFTIDSCRESSDFKWLPLLKRSRPWSSETAWDPRCIRSGCTLRLEVCLRVSGCRGLISTLAVLIPPVLQRHAVACRITPRLYKVAACIWSLCSVASAVKPLVVFTHTNRWPIHLVIQPEQHLRLSESLSIIQLNKNIFMNFFWAWYSRLFLSVDDTLWSCACPAYLITFAVWSSSGHKQVKNLLCGNCTTTTI